LGHFQGTALTLVIFTTRLLLVAWRQAIQLFPGSFPPLGAVEHRVCIVRLFMSNTAVERAWWAGVSVLAGRGEEISWRGVQVALVGVLTGDFWIAAMVCAISFGVAHIVQGWQSAALNAVFALGFHALLWLPGSLQVAMAGHIA
jgi:hypothetical protein